MLTALSICSFLLTCCVYGKRSLPRRYVQDLLKFATGQIQKNPIHRNTSDERQCYSASKSWLAISPADPPRPPPTKTLTRTYFHTSVFLQIQEDHQGKIYTDCDSIPRFKVTSHATTKTTKTVTLERNITSIHTFGPGYDSPRPTDGEWASYHDQWVHNYGKWKLQEPHCDWGAHRPENEDLCRAIRPHSSNLNNSVDSNKIWDYFNIGVREFCGRICFLSSRKEVALIYWPPVLTSRDICAANGTGTAKTLAPDHSLPSVVTMNEITFPGRDIILTSAWNTLSPIVGDPESWATKTSTTWDEPILGSSVLTGPFFFTSPTVYLAFHEIRGDGMWVPSTKWDSVDSTMKTLSSKENILVRSAGVIPLKADQVFSVKSPRKDAADIPGLAYAQLVANGQYTIPSDSDERRFEASTARDLEMISFDFGHLQDPVPASIYYDARSDDCWGILKQTQCGTITDGDYRPRLAFNSDVWKELVSDWYGCSTPGLVDPPIALIPARTMETPKITLFTTTQMTSPEIANFANPQPGNSPPRPWSQPTATALQEDPASPERNGHAFGNKETGRQGYPENTRAIHSKPRVPAVFRSG
jgi:hypothetical protein